MKVQLLVVAVLVLFGFGNAQTPECLAATQARQGVEDTCFGGNITEFDILLGQLLTSIGDFETGTAMIITNKVAYETALGQFCNQTCLDIHANYIKECSNISVDEVSDRKQTSQLTRFEVNPHDLTTKPSFHTLC